MTSFQHALHAKAARSVALTCASALALGAIAATATVTPAHAATVGAWPYTPGEVTVEPGDNSSTCYDEYVVPPGVSQLGVQAIGASGAAGNNNVINGTGSPGRDGDGVLAGNAGNGQAGGFGGFASEINTIIDVTPGQTLYVGAASDAFPGGAGGAAGMGLGLLPATGAGLRAVPGTGGSGGNASFVSLSRPGSGCTFSTAQLADDVLVVAAGGGGGGGAGSGQDAVHANGIIARAGGGDGGSESGSGPFPERGESFPWDIALDEPQVPGQSLSQRDAGSPGTNATGTAGGRLGAGGFSVSTIPDWKNHTIYGGTQLAALSCIPGQDGGTGQATGGGSGGSAAQALTARDVDVNDVISSTGTANVVSKISQSLRSNVTKISRMSAGLPKESFFESEGGIMLMLQTFYALMDHIVSTLTGAVPAPSVFLTGCGGLITDPNPGYYAPQFLAGLTTGGGGGGGGGIFGGGGGGGADDFYLSGGGGGGGAGASYVRGQSYAETLGSLTRGLTGARVRLTPIRTAPAVTVPSPSVTCVIHTPCSLPVDIDGYPVGRLGYLPGTSANLPSGLTFQQPTIHHSAVGDELAYDAWSASAAIGGTAQLCFNTGVQTYSGAFGISNSEGTATLPPITLDVRPGTLTSTSIAASYGDDLSNLYAGGRRVHLDALARYSSTCSYDVTTSPTGTWSVTDERNKAGDTVAAGSVLTAAPTGDGDEGLTPIGPGTAVVRFSYTDDWGQTKATQTTVTVAHGAPLSISFDASSTTLEPGGHTTPTVRADYGLGDIEDVTDQVTYSGVPSALNEAGLSITGDTLVAGTPLQVGTPTVTDAVTANLAGRSATLPVTIDFRNPTTISLQGNPATRTPLAPDSDDARFTANATYAAGGQADITRLATWSSNHPTIADVDDDGTVAVPFRTVGGPVTIAAALGSASGSSLVNVGLGAPDSIAVDDGNGHTGTASIGLGKVLQLHATGTVGPDTTDLTADTVWASSKPSVATVTSSGVVKVVGAGTADITATRSGVQGLLRLTADLSTPSSITITPTATTIPLGGAQRFSATGSYPGGTTADISDLVVWGAPSALGSFTGTLFSADSTHATPLTGSVTAQLGAATASVSVTKLGAAPTSITVSGPSGTVRLGESQQLTVTAHFFDGSTADVTRQVTWSTQDAGLFSVDTRGVVTAIAGSVSGAGSSTNVWATYAYTDTDGSARSYTAADHLAVDLTHPGSIAIAPITDSALANGTAHDLTATGTYANGYTADLSYLVGWQTSNTGDTSITGTYQRRLNVLAPPTPASTTVTASYGGVSTTIELALPGAFGSISGPSTGVATIGTPVSLDFSISGGAAPYTWSVPSSTRASDFTFSSTHGASTTLTFKPVAADWNATSGGAYTLVALVTDSLGHQSSQSVAVTLKRRTQTLDWVQNLADTAASSEIWFVSASSSAGLATTISIPSGVASNGCRYVGNAIRFDTGLGGTCTFEAAQAGDDTYAPAIIRKTVAIIASPEFGFYAPGTSFPAGNAVGAANGIVAVTKAPGDPADIVISTAGTTNDACSLTTASSNASGTSVYVHWDHIGTCVISASIPAAVNTTTGYAYPAATTSGVLTSTVSGWSSGIAWIDRYTAFNSGVLATANLKVGGTYQPVYTTATGVSDFFRQTSGHPQNPGRVTIAVVPAQSSPADACSVDTTKSSGIVTGQLTFAHAGTCAVVATQTATDPYLPATTSVKLLTVAPAAQTITNLRTTSTGTALIPGNTVTLAATTSSGLTPTYSVDPATTTGACSVDGSSVALLHAGRCVLAATQSGSADYAAAAPVKLTLTVTQPHLVLRSATSCTALQLGRALCTKSTLPPLSGPVGADPSIPVRVALVDADGNAVNAPSDLTVSLSSDLAGEGSDPRFQDLLHRDVTSAVIASGTSGVTVLYGDSVLGARTLHASGALANPDLDSVTSSPTPLSVLAAPAATIGWVGTPSDGVAGTPLPRFGVALYDDLGNPAQGSVVTVTATDVDSGSSVALSAGASAAVASHPELGDTAVFDAAVIDEPGTYTVSVTAEGLSLTSDPFRVAGSPSAPTDLVATWHSSSEVGLAWTAPDDGGSAITSYEVAVDGGPSTTVWDTNAVVGDLSPGGHLLEVRAVNGVGTSSAASISVTTPTVAGPPTAVSATWAAGTGVTVSWTGPTDTGGAPITGFNVYVDDALVTTVTDPSAVLGTLTAGSHTVAVTAVNAAGESERAAATVEVPVVRVDTAPGAPTRLTVSRKAANGAVVSWSAPSTDGGAAITTYRVYVDGRLRATTAARTATLTGLAVGVRTITVTAANAVGEGEGAQALLTIPAPVKAPGAPTIGKPKPGAKRGPLTAIAAWSAPRVSGGAPILGYEIVATRVGKPAKTVRKPGTARATRLELKLAAGTWVFKVRARNSAGWGAWSAASAKVKAR